MGVRQGPVAGGEGTDGAAVTPHPGHLRSCGPVGVADGQRSPRPLCAECGGGWLLANEANLDVFKSSLAICKNPDFRCGHLRKTMFISSLS